MPDFDKDFYTVEEVAKMFRVHTNTIYTMVKQHKIEHYKVGAQIRISRSELERLKIPAEYPDPNEN